MHYRVTHKTTFRYRWPVSFGNHLACLMLRAHQPRQAGVTELFIHPPPANRTQRLDYFGNCLCLFTIREPHRELLVEARSSVQVGPAPVLAPARSLPWEEAARAVERDLTPEGLDACQFRFESPRIRIRPEFAEYARLSFIPGRPIVESLLDLNSRIFNDFKFDSRVTNVRTPAEEVFKKRRGVCQDFAHVILACLRSIGLPARYVSGYLRTYPPPGKPRLVGADASHAWVSAFCPGFGWLDLDPTNNLVPGEGHVTLAWGRDYGDVSPLRGLILGGGAHTIRVGVDVEPVPDPSAAASPAASHPAIPAAIVQQDVGSSPSGTSGAKPPQPLPSK